MPNCKKCSKHFPNYLVIENKKRNVSNRKYCLECSQFNKHNTKQIHKEHSKEELKCSLCDRIYVYDLKNKIGHTKTKCNNCEVNERRFELKKKAVAYKGGKCEKCGYDKSLRAMSFHHKNPLRKDFNISGSHCYSWERIKQELDKCILLCANCHMEVHEDLER